MVARYAGMTKICLWITIVKKRGVLDAENNSCDVNVCIKKSIGVGMG